MHKQAILREKEPYNFRNTKPCYWLYRFSYIYSRTYAKALRLNIVMDKSVFSSIMGRTILH